MTPDGRGSVKQSILVIDDEPQVLTLLEQILRAEGSYDVTTVSNPLEVPRLLEKKIYDLIITDLGMPGLDGMEILRMVQEQERFEKVVVITAFGSMDSVSTALTLGAFDYIIKPFRKQQLLNTVERSMTCQSMHREALSLAAIVETEPFEEAEAAFRREYVRRLSERHGGDMPTMSKESGVEVKVLIDWAGGAAGLSGSREE